MESLQKNTLKSVLIIDDTDALRTDSDCYSSFESSSTTSNNSDQEIIENDVLEILPYKDYKTTSLSKDLLVSQMDIEDYKKPEEDINLLGRRKLNWVEISGFFEIK